MRAEDTTLWRFNRPVEDDSRLVCPECREDTPLTEWVETEVYCDTCGSHAAIVCPRCGEAHDSVYTGTIEVL